MVYNAMSGFCIKARTVHYGRLLHALHDYHYYKSVPWCDSGHMLPNSAGQTAMMMTFTGHTQQAILEHAHKQGLIDLGISKRIGKSHCCARSQ